MFLPHILVLLISTMELHEERSLPLICQGKHSCHNEWNSLDLPKESSACPQLNPGDAAIRQMGTRHPASLCSLKSLEGTVCVFATGDLLNISSSQTLRF